MVRDRGVGALDFFFHVLNKVGTTHQASPDGTVQDELSRGSDFLEKAENFGCGAARLRTRRSSTLHQSVNFCWSALPRRPEAMSEQQQTDAVAIQEPWPGARERGHL